MSFMEITTSSKMLKSLFFELVAPWPLPLHQYYLKVDPALIEHSLQEAVVEPVAASVVDIAKEFGGLGQHCEPALLRLDQFLKSWRLSCVFPGR